MKELPGLTTENAPIAEQNRKKLLAKYFRLSFQFSQGSDLVQSAIFDWLQQKGHITKSDLQVYTIDEAQKQRVPKHHEVFRDDVQMETTSYAYTAMVKSTDATRATIKSDESPLAFIAKNMIHTDLRYQVSENPRPGRDETQPSEPDGKNDPHASIFRKYVLLGTPTGTDAYDDLMKEINDEIAEDLEESLKDYPTIIIRQTQLANLRKNWESNHPGESFVPATWHRRKTDALVREPEVGQTQSIAQIEASEQIVYSGGKDQAKTK